MFKCYLRIILLAVVLMVLDDIDIFNRLHNFAYAAVDCNKIGSKATHSNCVEQLGTEVIAAIVGSILTALASLIVGYGVFISPEPFSKIAAVTLITAALGTFAALIIANAKFFACAFSFVRHPVLRDANGDYTTCDKPEQLFPGVKDSGTVCKTQRYKQTSDYKWPENGVPYSDFIEVCYRYPLIPFPLKKTLWDREYCFDEKGDTRDGKKLSGDIIKMKEWVGGPDSTVKCKTLQAGETTSMHSITFSAYEEGGSICIEATGSFGKKTWPSSIKIGCHLRTPSPPGPMCGKSEPSLIDDNGKVLEYDNSKCFNCYISPACYSKASLAIRAPTPMTSIIVQCVKESLSNLLTGKCSTKTDQKGFLKIAQDRLQDVVKATLVLAIALFGIKMMMGHAIQGPSEYFMLLIKVALVIYFALGDGMAFYYGELIKLSVGLSDLVMSAGGNSQICNYKSSDYQQDLIDMKTGKKLMYEGTNNPVQVDNSYLVPWDRLDCRIFFYLGSGFPVGGAATVGTAALVAAAFNPVFGVLVIILPAIFSSQILLAICVFFFIVMLILTIIWIVHLFILSLIALTIIALFAPLFVPMVLFQATKGFFDGWLRQLTAFSIYPIILFAFLALVFSVFDTMYFGKDLKFKSVTKQEVIDKKKNIKRTKESFILADKTQCADPKIGNTLACVVSAMTYTNSNLVLGIKVTKGSFDKSGTEDIWKNFAMMGLMGFLFYHFLGVIGGMAAELSGSFRADLSKGSMGPKEMASKLQAGAMKTANTIGGAAGAAAKGAYNKAKGGGKEGGGKEEVSRSVPKGGEK